MAVIGVGDRFGPYEIVARLGAGGMGDVFRARDERLGRDVALKVVSERVAGSPDARSRFEQEARAVAALSHPNIVALYDIGRQPRFAHDFFVKYQDRLLFGKDNYQPDEYPYYWRVLETSDEYFDYYRDYHAFWKLYGIALPDDVLKKLYFGNALKIIPGLSRTGFPR